MAILNYMQVLEQEKALDNVPSITVVARAAVSAAKVLRETFSPTVTLRGTLQCFSDIRYDPEQQRLSLRTGVCGGRCYWETIHPHPLILEELIRLGDDLLEARLRALDEDREELTRDYVNLWNKN